MIEEAATPIPRLFLERFEGLNRITAAIAFLPRGWKAISERKFVPSYSFHIFDQQEHALGISGQALVYPISESDLHLLQEPLLRLEDRRFFSHIGIDFRAVVRAAFANIRARKWVQGAGTITQQLIRNTLLTPHRSLLRKALEVLFAWKLERHYGKHEILKLYCELVYLGNGTCGFSSAARAYFRRPLGRLSGLERSGLLGLLRSPSRFSPDRRTSSFWQRASLIHLWVGAPTDGSKSESPSHINPIRPASISKPRLASLIRDDLRRTGAPGIPSRVVTSIHTDVQRVLDSKLQAISRSKTIQSCAAILVSNADARVIAESAWSNGRDQQFSPSYFGAIQPGSTFKTFALLAALEQGFSLDTTLESGPFVSKMFRTRNGEPWSVRNFGHIYRGSISLLEAFRLSDNTAFARLLESLNVEHVYDVYRRFRLCGDLKLSPAIILGGVAKGVSLRRLVEAYGCIAQDGIWRRLCVARDVRYYGDSSLSHVVSAELDIGLEQSVCKLLKVALLEAGYVLGGKRFSGKTGTTKKGNIFVGYTPEVSAAMWVGFRREIPEWHRKTATAVRILDSVADFLFGSTGASLKI